MIVGSLLLIVISVGLLGLGLVAGSNSYLVGSIVASLLAAITLIVGSRQAGRRRTADVAEPAVADGVESSAGAAAADSPPADPLPVGSRSGDPLPGEAELAAVAADSDPGAAVGSALEISLDPATVDEHPQAAEHPDAAERPVDAAEAAIPAQGAAADVNRTRGPNESTVDGGGVDGGFGDEEPMDEPPTQRVSADDTARVAQLDDAVFVIDGRPRYHLERCSHLGGRDHEQLPVAEAVELGFTPCGRCEPDRELLAQPGRV